MQPAAVLPPVRVLADQYGVVVLDQGAGGRDHTAHPGLHWPLSDDG